jgi:hypothetical protein
MNQVRLAPSESRHIMHASITIKYVPIQACLLNGTLLALDTIHRLAHVLVASVCQL